MTPRYIDANRIQWYSKWLTSGDKRVFAYQDEIDNIPTADVEEVRHGYWIEDKYNEFFPYKCSLCGDDAEIKYKYCHCGAKMDGKEK